MMSIQNLAILLLEAGLFAGSALAVNNGLARTPQMGWNNWNTFGCAVSESLLLSTAKTLVDIGLRDLGYEYVVLDDCWSQGRDENKMLVADKGKFPHGMGYVADGIHDLGLKFGMYSSAGEFTCARFPGSLDLEKEDATAFASWGVNYLKYDNCYHMGRMGTPQISFNRYNEMWKALNATGRPILYSLCNWGEDYPHTWGMSLANSWRIGGDIYDSFTRPDDLCSCNTPSSPFCIAPGTRCSVLNIVNKVAPYVDRSQPGGWNDLDMLEVGNGGMTDDEYVAHFSLWAILKSPLLLGNDVRSLTPKALSILNNPAIIAVSQDAQGQSAARVRKEVDGVPKDKYGVGERHIWSGPLANGDQVVLLLNAGNEDADMTTDLSEIFVGEGPEGSAPQAQTEWEVWDLWGKRMSDEDAERVLAAGKTKSGAGKVLKGLGWFDVRKHSYREGVEREDERLFGSKVGILSPGQEWTVNVRRHAVVVYRLRAVGGAGKRKSHFNDEL